MIFHILIFWLKNFNKTPLSSICLMHQKIFLHNMVLMSKNALIIIFYRFLYAIVLLCAVLINTAKAEMQFLEWQENANVSQTQKISNYKLLFKITNLPANYFTTSFIINVSPSSDYKLDFYNILVDGKVAKYSYQNNALEIFFPQGKKNSDQVFIQYSAKYKYLKFNKYLHQNQIYIPQFAFGAKAKVVVNFAPDFRLISIHNNATLNENQLIYQIVVPEEGVQEILKFTNKKVAWDVSISNTITSNNVTGSLKVIVPYVFYGGAQEVQDQVITANLMPENHLTTKENNIFDFALKNFITNITITNKANIITGENHSLKPIFEMQKYLDNQPDELSLLLPIIEKIKLDPTYKNLPLYAKIGKFVHSYLQYDASYFGKLLTVPQILSTKKGVCAEFATLYNALARAAGIPSAVVYGYAYGEYNKFESHAWNMVYANNTWFYVDPTWNLLNGAVSSSHIYVQDNRNDDIKIEYKGFDSPKFMFDKKFNITEIYAFN